MSFVSDLLGSKNNYTVTNGLPAGTQANIKNYDSALDMGGGSYRNADQGLTTLAQALQSQMNGQGPNLANALLQQATGQNVANQAALMAGQRGASGNVGLIARQAANVGSNAQMQEAGQASVNRMQQQLQAQQQLGGVLGTQGQLGNQMYNTGVNAIQGQNAMITGSNLQASQGNANIAGQNASQFGNIAGGILNAGGNLLSKIPMGGGIAKGAFAGADPMQGAQKMFAADGGEVPSVQQPGFISKFLSGTHGTQMLAQGGSVLPFSPVNLVQGGPVQAQAPQQQAVAQGDSLKNDKIPAMVSEGEIVLPRSITMHPDAPQMAAKFVMDIIAKRGAK